MTEKSNLKFNLDMQFFAGTLDRTKIVSKIQIDSSDAFDIVPNKIANASGDYYAELPTLTQNETIATGTQLATKQDTLVSGTNIKTINGQNILGSGNVTIEAGVSSVNGKTGAVTLTKGDIGLGNVDNTSDANKPISTATQTALNAKLDKKPDGTNDLIDSSVNKVNEIYIPDYILGQLVYGGLVNASTGVATLSDSAKSKLGITSDTVTLTPSAYATYENIYFVVNVAGTFASIAFKVGDWLIATGSAWGKVDNTDEVTSVNGKTGAVTLATDDISDTNQAHKFVIELEDNSSTTAGTWLAKTNAITSLVDGQMFLYKITVAGANPTTLNITANGTSLGAKTVYRVGTTKLTTQYPVGHYLLLVYNSLNTCFRVVNDSDASSYAYVRQYQYGSNAAGSGTKYPILTRYNLTNKSGTYDTAYTRFHTDVTVDTSDGALYANDIYANGSIVATAASMTAGTYSSVTVNSQGIVTAGSQIIQVIENGATPTVATGGWYFEKDA